MTGRRISELTALSGAGSANNDDIVIFDATASETKRISRSQLAEGMTPDLPLQYYLGVLNSNPTQRLNGDALTLGDYYLDAVTKYTTIYNGSGWNSYASVIAAQTASEAARDAAIVAKDAAQLAETNAETAETNAELAEVNAEAARDAAIVAKTAAELAKTNAEAARDAAVVNASLYSSVAAGLAATTNGQYFTVPGADDATYLILYRNDAGTAQEVASYPSLTALESAVGTLAPNATSLLGTETQGVAVDATAIPSAAVRVIDNVTPANNFNGAFIDFLASTCFPSAKVVTLQDGSIGWSDHNFMYDSEGFAGGWTKTAITASAPVNGLSTLTATSTVASLFDNAQLLLEEYYYAATFIAKAGTAPFAYIRFQTAGTITNRYAYFNLSAGSVGTIDAGLTANIYTTDEAGGALATGEYRIVVSAQVPLGTTTFSIHYGLADANASTAVTNGRTGFLRRSQLNWGVKSCGYIKTTVGVRYGIPYDWSKGGRRVLIEEFLTQFASKYGDDLTKAQWTSTNCTPVVDATGPHGRPCSSLTGTADNWTCLQSITSAFPKNTFQARVKRRTGTGAVYMTINGGTTWVDITSQINSSTFSLVYVHGSSTSVSMGFRGATNGDVIEVADAINGGDTNGIISSPRPTYGPTGVYQRNSDIFRIPFTKFNSGSAFTYFFDYELSADLSANGEAAGVAGPAPAYHYVQRSGSGLLRTSLVGGTTYTNFVADLAASLRIEGAMRIKANDVAATSGGVGECYDNRLGVGTLTNISIGSDGGQIYLRRILLVPRALADDELRTWRYSGVGADPRYLADIKVARHAEAANTFICREPSVEILRDTDDYALISMSNMQRSSTANPSSGEAPARIVRATFRFDKNLHTLTNVTGQQVVAQQASWASGLGHQQGPVQSKLIYGAKRGRLLLLYGQLDTANGLLSPDWRRIYCTYSDDNGATWAAPTMVYDPGSTKFALPCGSGNPVQFTTGAYAGRVVVPIYSNSGCGVLYSNDNGVTWAAGTLTNAGAEPTVHMLPDGATLVMTMRQETSPWRTYATSTNGGATWSVSSNMTLTEGTNVAMAVTQNDPEGGNGLYGEPLLVGARRSAPTYLIRSKLTIEALNGANLAVSGSQFTPIGQYRSTGYASAQPLSGGYLAVGYESAPTGVANNYCDIRLMVVSWP